MSTTLSLSALGAHRPSVPGAGGDYFGDPGRSPRCLGPFRHSIILASEVFKEASRRAVWVVVVGEQVAGSPTFSPAPAQTGTLQGEKGEFKPCPQVSHSQPFPVSCGRGSKGAQEPLSGWYRNHEGAQSWEKALAASSQGSSSPAPSAPEAPGWRCPQRRSAGGSWDDATPSSVGPRTPWGSGRGDSCGLGKLGREGQ